MHFSPLSRGPLLNGERSLHQFEDETFFFWESRHDAYSVRISFFHPPTLIAIQNKKKRHTQTKLFILLFCSLRIAVPSKPLNLSVLEVTSTTITIGWREPENLNGAIMGYRVFYIHQNQTYFATIRSGTAVGELITYVLNDLSEYI